LVAKFVFGVPMIGSFGLLALALGFYIAANLAVGYTFSTIAENQLQAMQMTMFFLLPAILLSGFRLSRSTACRCGRNGSARCCRRPISCRIVRGILLKGNGLWGNLAQSVAAHSLYVRRGRDRAWRASGGHWIRALRKNRGQTKFAPTSFRQVPRYTNAR
jgi:ABC-2 type transport system permease protein